MLVTALSNQGNEIHNINYLVYIKGNFQARFSRTHLKKKTECFLIFLFLFIKLLYLKYIINNNELKDLLHHSNKTLANVEIYTSLIRNKYFIVS